MKNYEATEIAYKNGYEAGKKYAEHEILILKQKRANMFEILDAYERGRVNALKWIPVSERLPEDDSDVLAYLRIGEEGRIYPANYAKGMWFDCIFNTPATNTTTHWMPLPEPPKEGNNG